MKRYRLRIAQFVDQMAKEQFENNNIDSHMYLSSAQQGSSNIFISPSSASNQQFYNPFSNKGSQSKLSLGGKSSLFPQTVRSRDRMNSGYSMPRQKPLKFMNLTKNERISQAMKANGGFDTEPGDIDKKAFVLRKRDTSKELHPHFHLKSHSSLERLEDLYDVDEMVIDK